MGKYTDELKEKLKKPRTWIINVKIGQHGFRGPFIEFYHKEIAQFQLYSRAVDKGTAEELAKKYVSDNLRITTEYMGTIGAGHSERFTWQKVGRAVKVNFVLDDQIYSTVTAYVSARTPRQARRLAKEEYGINEIVATKIGVTSVKQDKKLLSNQKAVQL